jgi:hypothetical protein
VAYISEWERLSDALGRVMAIGVSRSQAKRDLCDAIVDRKIGIRHLDDDVRVPPDLDPQEFDWQNSRSRSSWEKVRNGNVIGRWRPPRIELRCADVTSVLCRGERGKSGAGKATATAAQEEATIKALASHLNSLPKERRGAVTRAKAEAWCRTQGFTISQRGFQSRVWPEARNLAGLPRIAEPGRKRKSPR